MVSRQVDQQLDIYAARLNLSADQREADCRSEHADRRESEPGNRRVQMALDRCQRTAAGARPSAQAPAV